LEKSSLNTVTDCEPEHQSLYSKYMGIKFNAAVKVAVIFSFMGNGFYIEIM
jgi:hypothetical protein